LTLLAVDPVGLRGLWLRGRAGPVRDRVIAALAPFSPRRLHPFMGADALEGGLDLTATLAQGQMVMTQGLLHGDGWLILTMAERCSPGWAVRLGQALDTRPGLTLFALDEAADETEGLPPALSDRLGLFLDLDGLSWAETDDIDLPLPVVESARARLRHVQTGTGVATVARLCADLGVGGMRAPLLALACARAHAAWRGAETLAADDLRIAAELTLGHRATRFPDSAPPDDTPAPPDPGEAGDQGKGETLPDIPQEMLIEAARAALPDGLLEQLQAARMARTQGAASGAGAKRQSRMRGRPLPSRAGKPGAGARVDLVATLRQAAPWQSMRRAALGCPDRLIVLPGDIRIKRFQDRTDRVLIFAVDASGSAAFARLGEAKGAVELMLARAYASRDHVALVTFRGDHAELALPPTRSLVQAKRRLAGLPGGGATPLADALRLALDTARQARARGMAPTLAFLTDGRGNIALDGTANRAQATEDAARLARICRAEGWPAVILDTSLRPKPGLAELAAQMGARLVALPRTDARGLSATLSTLVGARA
jgi:magnesium chelatase subunit D